MIHFIFKSVILTIIYEGESPTKPKLNHMKEIFTHMLIPQKSVGFPLPLSGTYLHLFASFLVHALMRSIGSEKDENGQPLKWTTLPLRETFFALTLRSELNLI